MRPINDLPAEYYLELITENVPFQFSRFGDGEVLCMFHSSKIDRNCDGSKFLDEIEEPMKQIFRNKYKYFHCLLDCTFEPVFKHEVEKFKKFIETTCPEMPFFNGEVWQHLSFSGRIGEFIDAIAPHKPCFIGGSHIINVAFMKGIGEISFIKIPSVDAFKSFQEIYNSVIVERDRGTKMFLFSAGYSTKPLIDTLFPFIGHDTFLIDMGSVFDPYCGKLSRHGMRHVGKEYFQQFTDYTL